MCMLLFTGFMTDLLVKKFGYKFIEAKDLAALVPLIGMGLVPILSAVVQVIGQKPIFWTSSSILATGLF